MYLFYIHESYGKEECKAKIRSSEILPSSYPGLLEIKSTNMTAENTKEKLEKLNFWNLGVVKKTTLSDRYMPCIQYFLTEYNECTKLEFLFNLLFC